MQNQLDKIRNNKQIIVFIGGLLFVIWILFH